MPTDVAPDSRRRLRRLQTIEQILASALEAMAVDGVAGMSLSDVARRVGIRPPSLYEYFPSKLAIYDAIFQAGYEALGVALNGAVPDLTSDPLGALRTGHQAFVRWCVENPIQAELMFWRPVPGFVPSEQAYVASLAQLDLVRTVLVAAVHQGQLLPAALTEEAIGLYLMIGSGLITQQLSNDPDSDYSDGRYSRLATASLEMWISRYSPDTGSARAQERSG